MRAVLDYSGRRPWLVLLLLLVFSLLAASQLARVKIQVSSDDLLLREDPERDFYQQVRERYGSERVVLVYLRDPRILEASRLEVVRGALTELETYPWVDRVESLFSVPWLKSVEGFLDKDPYLAKLPTNVAEEQRILQAALDNRFLRNVLVAEDGQAMALAVLLADNQPRAPDSIVDAGIARAIEPLRSQYSEVFAIGFPQIRSEIGSAISSEQVRLLPVALLALVLALFALLRRFLDVLLPVITATLSIVWILGIMGALGLALNVVTSIVPILLIVVGSTQDVHLLAEFRRGKSKGISTRRALDNMGRKMGRTVVLTFITTFVGFLSVGLSRIEMLWQFGLLVAVGLLLNFLITITLIPAALALLVKDGDSARAGALSRRREGRLADHYWHWLYARRKWVVGGMILITLVSMAGIPAIKVNHNPMDSLASHSEVRAHITQVNKDLSGLESFSVVVRSGIQDTFLKARYLEQLVAIQEFLAKQGLARSSTSFADYLSLLNGAFQELDAPALPDSDEVVNELMIFLDYQRVAGYVSPDYSEARLVVRHDISSTAELRGFIKGLRQYLDENLDPGLSARVTGDSVLTLSATDGMIYGQLQSILLLLGFIVAIVALLFTDLRAGLLAALPNAFPVVVLFGFMGYADIPLNIGTTMAATIAIGIAVDDTMHFMLRYNQELKFYKVQSHAVQQTIRGEMLPVFATSLALILGFSVFALSDFTPIAQFGVLSALVIVTALLADFMLTPIAISTLRLVTLWELLSIRLRKEVIGRSSMFRGMSQREIKRFILSSTLVDYQAGTRIFSAGEPSDDLYLVMSGKVEVRVPRGSGPDCEMIVDTFVSGDLLGGGAVLARDTRKGNAIAMETTSLLVLNEDGINNAVRNYPNIAAKLFYNIATDVSQRWVRFIDRATRNEICEPTQKEDTDHANG